MARSTHTYVELEISRAAFDEIAAKLKAADYGHAFIDPATIDMHGIAVTRESCRHSLEPILGWDTLQICSVCRGVTGDRDDYELFARDQHGLHYLGETLNAGA
jgi:hypothetical protein